MAHLILIAAVAPNGAIGINGKLPWPKVKEDLAWFKKVTLGHTIIMGRKTWDSIGQCVLPGRVNIILSRTPTKVKIPVSPISLMGATTGRILSSQESNNTSNEPKAPTVLSPAQEPVFLTSIDVLLSQIKANSDAEAKYFIIGGAEIYTQFLHTADEIWLNLLTCENAYDTWDLLNADAFFPPIDPQIWNTECTEQPMDEATETEITRAIFTRKTAQQIAGYTK